MIRPGFLSSSDRIELEACVRRQREDHGIARRANAILLLDDGESCGRIAKFLYLDDDTIRGWHKTYLQDGWDALAYDALRANKSETFDRLKFTLEGAGDRTNGYARTSAFLFAFFARGSCNTVVCWPRCGGTCGDVGQIHGWAEAA